MADDEQARAMRRAVDQFRDDMRGIEGLASVSVSVGDGESVDLYRREEANVVKDDEATRGRVLWRGTRELPFMLTPEELTLRGRVIGEKMEQRRQLDEERLATMADFKARREELDKAIADIGRTLQTGTELREVKCETVIDEAGARAETLRTDTGEVIDFRPLTAEERQRELFRRNATAKGGEGDGAASKKGRGKK